MWGSCTFRAEWGVRIIFAKQVVRSLFNACALPGLTKEGALNQKRMGWKGGGEAATQCCHLGRTLKPQGVGPESTIAFKKLLPTCFAKLILTTRSALKVHKPFTNTFHYSFCKNDPHYSSSPESARALQKLRNCGFNFPSSLIPLQAKGIRLVGL